MNTKHFNQLVAVTRKNVSDTWADEEFIAIGTVRGLLQPVSGDMITSSGKVDTNQSHLFYCPADSDIKTGDILIDSYGRELVVSFAQVNGIAGRGDHMEASLMARE